MKRRPLLVVAGGTALAAAGLWGVSAFRGGSTAVDPARWNYAALGKEAIRDRIVAEIRDILPAAKEAELLHSRVVTALM